MVTSYLTGANYVVFFNYPTFPETNLYGAMNDAHFDALENFWNNVVTNSEVVHGSAKAEAVLVLPQNYGWGNAHTRRQNLGILGTRRKNRPNLDNTL